MEKYVLWFKVSMNNIVFMHMFNPKAYLPHILSYCLFWEPSHLFEIMIKIFSQAGLENKISCIFINKEVIKIDNMRMNQKGLYFYLSYKLL